MYKLEFTLCVISGDGAFSKVTLKERCNEQTVKILESIQIPRLYYFSHAVALGGASASIFYCISSKCTVIGSTAPFLLNHNRL